MGRLFRDRVRGRLLVASLLWLWASASAAGVLLVEPSSIVVLRLAAAGVAGAPEAEQPWGARRRSSDAAFERADYGALVCTAIAAPTTAGVTERTVVIAEPTTFAMTAMALLALGATVSFAPIYPCRRACSACV